MTVQWCTVTKCCFCPLIHCPCGSWHKRRDTTGLLPVFSLVIVSYSSLFPFICASLHLPFASFSVVSPPLSPLPFSALVPCSDCIWHDLYNRFTALAALRGIDGIPEYFPASLRVNVFFSCTLCYWYIYLPFLGCLPPPAVRSTLCNVRNTSPSAPLHCKHVILMCSSHSFILCLLKSRSALLFINCCFTTPLVFPLLLKQLQILQCKISFYDFWCGLITSFVALKEAGSIKK